MNIFPSFVKIELLNYISLESVNDENEGKDTAQIYVSVHKSWLNFCRVLTCLGQTTRIITTIIFSVTFSFSSNLFYRIWTIKVIMNHFSPVHSISFYLFQNTALNCQLDNSLKIEKKYRKNRNKLWNPFSPMLSDCFASSPMLCLLDFH